jgi:hypothetical protein
MPQENLLLITCAVGGLMFGLGVGLGLIIAPRPPPLTVSYVQPPVQTGGGCGTMLLALVGLGLLFLLWQSSVVAGLNP